jgi:soluble lytic murein transglycosylase-like protein
MIARRTRNGWKTAPDYRVICDCQKHRPRRRSVWSRVATIASRSMAVLVTVPLAVTAFDLPIAAMNIKTMDFEALRITRIESSPGPQQASALPIFTTPAIREQFLSTQVASVSLDVFKEQFFKSQVPYGEIIYREARRNNLPPELVAAMVHTESDFRPGLVSNKSAQGLMQIVPETARVLGIADPFDPEENIAAGTRYFRQLLNRFEDQRIALAAYNAGPTNVERFGGVPPFPETQQYIEKVSRRHNRYRERVRNGYVTMRMANVGH